MANKKKKVALDQIPTLLESIIGVIDREVNALGTKTSLSADEARTLIAYASTLSTIYKEYRAEVLTIQKDLKSKSKEEILSLVKAETK